MGRKKNANAIRETKARKRAARKKKYAQQHKENMSARKNKYRNWLLEVQEEYLKKVAAEFESK